MLDHLDTAIGFSVAMLVFSLMIMVMVQAIAAILDFSW
jgi:hypothetical protein